MPVVRQVAPGHQKVTPEMEVGRRRHWVGCYAPEDWLPKVGGRVSGQMDRGDYVSIFASFCMHGPWITGRFCGLFTIHPCSTNNPDLELAVVETDDGLRYVLYDLWPAVCCTKCGAELDFRAHRDWLYSISSGVVAFGSD
jgi:hypothetical protein